MKELKEGTLALVKTPKAFLYDRPEEDAFPQSDEALSGWAVLITGEERQGRVPVVTHYGYTGWIRTDQLRAADRPELAERPGTLRRVAAPWMDIYAEPKVQGRLLTALPRGSFVQRAGEDQDGWMPVRAAGGETGWAHTAAMAERLDDDGFLLGGGTDRSWFRRKARETMKRAAEDEIREALVRTAASYLHASYRWGGKTPEGIDCSGLAFMSYMENGILIYRDAQIREEYPVREIPLERIGKGDLIFFPGHVAIYAGDGRYLHATAWKDTPWVTVNSLNPQDAEYRQDLAEKIQMCGSIF